MTDPAYATEEPFSAFELKFSILIPSFSTLITFSISLTFVTDKHGLRALVGTAKTLP